MRKIAAPGKTTSHHICRFARASLSTLPQLAEGGGGCGTTWSYGTAASPSPLEDAAMDDRGPFRPLSPMELEHLHTRAAEPYRDPSGQASAAAILAARQRAQLASPAPSTSAWRRRWGLSPRPGATPEPRQKRAT